MSALQWDLCIAAEKMEQLASVVRHAGSQRMLILCHNNPDPDTIASAFGLQFVLSKKFGMRSIIGYGGVVARAENKAMLHRLRIKMTRMAVVKPSDYFGIALVDAQPGTGNNLLHAGDPAPLIVVDHHPLRKASRKAELHDVRPDYGATSTIITEYIVVSGLEPSRSVANALLYGLKTDTNSLVRGAIRADFQAFRYLFPFTNPRVLAGIEKPRLSLGYFRNFERGLACTTLHRDVAVSWLGKINSESIIPELADLLLRMEGISWSLCMGDIHDLMVLSLRSTSRKLHAGNVIRRLVGKTGSSGGHKEMAGGVIPFGNMLPEEREEFQQRLVNRLLKLINREGARPKSMVNAEKALVGSCKPTEIVENHQN
jgi:nanoRNase/pAp phosphatase (c-di-AMP/oligoRNAs hydrolase)